MEIKRDILLKDWTWWKIGGPADQFCLPRTIDEVREALDLAARSNLKTTLLGGGTNVLAPDEGLRGLVVCTRELRAAEAREVNDRLVIEALAGTPKSELVKLFLKSKLPPALFLCGLPGDVGGGVVMNAGVAENSASPREFKEIVDWVEVLSPAGELRRYLNDELTWTYRSSSGYEGVVVRVGMSWPLRDQDMDLPRKVKDATKRRLASQPLELPSCGSTFKNPPGHHAGALIERAGLKGQRVGGAEISLKHANFIVNRGGARASDVKTLIVRIQSEVARQFGVTLETEVRFL